MRKSYNQMPKNSEGAVSVGQLKLEANITTSKSAKFSKLLAQTGYFQLLNNNSQARLLV